MVRTERHPMPAQPARERIRNFDEVALGYTPALADDEAQRCLNCKNAPCMSGVAPSEFISPTLLRRSRTAICASRRYSEAGQQSRCDMRKGVSPKTNVKNIAYAVKKLGGSVAIGNLERYVADWARVHGRNTVADCAPTGKRVAVVGSGPASLSCSADLPARALR